jgi:hypothetical protein
MCFGWADGEPAEVEWPLLAVGHLKLQNGSWPAAICL